MDIESRVQVPSGAGIGFHLFTLETRVAAPPQRPVQADSGLDEKTIILCAARLAANQLPFCLE